MKCENRKKIVVLSDSHGNIQPMLDVVRFEKPDLILHLGDVSQAIDTFNEVTEESYS